MVVCRLCIGMLLALLCCGIGQADDRPNIVIIMADDMGFSDVGAYGGEIKTPNIDRLASEGMRFKQFYNNAKCSPTRASLLTGLYSQQCRVHNGPVIMGNCATIAEVLGAAGYRTLMAGKWHSAELPTDRGFERYYGLADGCCNFFNPGDQRDGEAKPAHKTYPRRWSIDGEVFKPFTPKDPDFYTTDAFTDNALGYLDEYKDDENPFLLYLAYTAPHYPLHARLEWIEKYRGKYLKGWDALREERYARMVKMGLIDEKWALSPQHGGIPDWDSLTEKEKKEWDLRMAVYAAMVDRMDWNIGRVIEKLEAQNKLDNTLILFLSDNGGCAEHVTKASTGVAAGPVNSYEAVKMPWANAQNTPFRKFKRYDHEGGISTPLIAHWPKTIKPGTMTDAPGHIIDIMATVLELGKATYPTEMKGDKVEPLEGKSLVPVLKGGTREGHEAIYWQFGSSDAMRAGDWKIVRDGNEHWELYNLVEDRTELNDLAKVELERAAQMGEMWTTWAKRTGAKIR